MMSINKGVKCPKGIEGPRIYKLTITKLKGAYELFAAYNFDDLCNNVDKILKEYKLKPGDVTIWLANNAEAEDFILKK